jgi:RNA-directed DNA polymerase
VQELIGRIERGFDYLGYHFTRAGLSIARKTFVNFLEKTSRLYEQECHAGHASAALEMYVRRWVRWTTSGRVGVVEQGQISSWVPTPA